MHASRDAIALETLRRKEEFLPLFLKAARAVWQQKNAVQKGLVSQARKRVAELLEYQEQIVKAWISERIAKEIYEDQIRKVGTDSRWLVYWKAKPC